MKMYYTKSELKSLTPEELLDLTTFGGEENTYYYADLEKVQKEEGEYSFIFKDKTVIYTQEIDTFDKIALGKARFELVSASLKDNKEAEIREREFQEEIKNMISTQMTAFDNSRKTNNTNFELTIDSMKDKYEKTIEALDKKMYSTQRVWTNKIKQLEDFDTEAYNIKMQKLDKIIKAFDELLK